MNQLFFTSIIAVSIASAALASTVNIVADRYISKKLTDSLESGFEDFKEGYSQFQSDNIVYSWVEDCPPGHSSGDSECVWDRVVSDDGSIDVLNWEAELIPDYLRLPSYAVEFSWSMGNTTGGGTYVCAWADMTEYVKFTMRTLRKNHREESLVIGDQCDPGYSYAREDIDIHTGAIYTTVYL